MLRTNLSTRPFYNERAVHAVLLVVALVAMSVLIRGSLQLTSLLAERAVLAAAAERDEQEAAEILRETVGLQRGASAADLESLALAASLANRLIDQRVFSWTEFFNRIEATHTSDVMLTALRPNVESGVIEVSIGIIGRDIEAIDRFIGQLEGTGAFADMLCREEEITDDGSYRATLLGRYLSSLDTEPAL